MRDFTEAAHENIRTGIAINRSSHICSIVADRQSVCLGVLVVMYPYWTKNWETPKREEKEDKQNRRITEVLAGRRCPEKEDILKKWKGAEK